MLCSVHQVKHKHSIWKMVQKVSFHKHCKWSEVRSFSCPNDSKGFKMIQNDSKWLKIIQNDSKWFKMIQTDSNWFKLIQTDSNWFKLIENNSKRFEVIQNYANWFKTIQNDTKLLKLIQNDTKWFKIIQNYSIWLEEKNFYFPYQSSSKFNYDETFSQIFERCCKWCKWLGLTTKTWSPSSVSITELVHFDVPLVPLVWQGTCHANKNFNNKINFNIQKD